MTWATHAARTQRTPLTAVEVDLDWYDDESIDPTNPDGSLCYRTPATTDQGTFELTSKTRRWQSHDQDPIASLGAIPCVVRVNSDSEEIRIGSGLARFGQATIVLRDFVDADQTEDPFRDDVSRASKDHSASTYFRKLLARNPYWTGRTLRIKEGWSTDGTWIAADSITKTYVVRDIQGPTGGSVTITAVGPLQLLGLNNIQVPTTSRGRLLQDLTASATAATITPENAASDYGSSGYARIDDEIVGYTRDGLNLTLTRAQWNTVADSHSADGTIQECVAWTDTSVTTILTDLLTTHGGVDASYIDSTGWEDERDTWLTLYNFDAILSEPEKIVDIVRNILETCAAYMWWDDENALLRLRALRPAQANSATWTDADNLLSAPKIQRDMGERVSRADVLIQPRSWSAEMDEQSTYRVRVLGQETGDGETQHKTSQVAVIMTRWLDSEQINLAVRAGYQTAASLRDGLVTYTIEVPAKDASLRIGEIVLVHTRNIVDRDGTVAPKRMLLTKRTPSVLGGKYIYKCRELPFVGRFSFFTAANLGDSQETDFPDYDNASDAQRDPGAFFTNEAGTIPDPPYLFG